MWWPSLDSDLEHYVRYCSARVFSGKSIKPVIRPMKVITYESKPWTKIAIDIFGDIKVAPVHKRYIIICIDLCTHFPEVNLCDDVTSRFFIDFLKDLFSRYSLVYEILNDNGAQFVSHEF